MTDTFTVRAMPKISIDPGIEILDSHSRTPPEHWLPLCSSALTSLLGLKAAQQIVSDLDAVANHVEAIKIFFYWNRNHGDYQRICASAVLVEPGSNNKEKVEAHARIWLGEVGTSDVYDEPIGILSKNLQQALRWQIMHFQEQRERLTDTFRFFGGLLAEVRPLQMKDKAHYGNSD